MRVRYTLPAAAELDYLATQAPQGARNVQNRIKAVEVVLAEFPAIGRPTSRSGVRRATAFPYLYFIFYRVTGNEIVILRVRHAARNPACLPGRHS